MLYVFNVVLPVFALILIGYVCGRTGKLGVNASTELNRFVVWLALPAQLFNFASNSGWQTLWQPGFISAFFFSCLAVFILVLSISWYRSKDLAAASFNGLSASYSNTGYMGIPLCALALGQDGLAPAIISTFIVFVMFAVATVLIEIGILAHKKPHEIFWSATKSLCTNPLLIAPVAGLFWAASDLEMYDPIAQVIAFLAAASSLGSTFFSAGFVSTFFSGLGSGFFTTSLGGSGGGFVFLITISAASGFTSTLGIGVMLGGGTLASQSSTSTPAGLELVFQ